MSNNRPEFVAEGEMMWPAVFRNGEFADPTYGQDRFIPQAVYDHGGQLMYDVTKPNAIIPLDDAEVDKYFETLRGAKL